jgi:(2Fe-2S) ferredoxin
MTKLNSLADLEKYRKSVISGRNPDQIYVTVCGGTGCHAMDSDKLVDALSQEISKHKLASKVSIRRTGCHGFCEHGPIVVIFPQEICYLKVGVQDVPEIISETILKGKPVERLLFKDIQTGKPVVFENEIPFYKHQVRLMLGNNRLVDPQSIDDYIALGGYSALVKTLFEIGPEKALKMIKDSNLRGRGG